MIENVDKIIEREMQVEILVKKAGSLEQQSTELKNTVIKYKSLSIYI